MISTAGSNSMPTATKNSTAKASRSGRVSCAARWESSLSREDHAGKERAEREADAEEIGRAGGDAERDREHREAEELAAAGMGGEVQHHRDQPAADDEHEADEGRELDHRDGDDAAEADVAAGEALDEGDEGIGVRRDGAARELGEGRDQDEREDHRDVLDDHPADGDAAAVAVEEVAVLQRLEEHDGRGDREREAEDDAGQQRPAERQREAEAHQRAGDDAAERAGDGDRLDRDQVLEREVEPDAEHQEDDADFAELVGDLDVGDKARAMGADDDAGDEIADERAAAGSGWRWRRR